MLVTAVAFSDVVLAVHIAAAIITFGVIFAYPVIYLAAAQLGGPPATAVYYRMRVLLGRRLISPGLVVVLVAGIYLASHLHQWKLFYVQWGLAMVVIIGGVVGAFLTPRAKKLAELAERDASGAEYRSLSRQVAMVDLLILVLVLATVYLMTVRAG
jgi:hypothetical protein